MVHDVLREKFECTECGQHFISQAALRRHEYGQHLTEEQQQDRKMASRRDAQPSVMDHSLDGMPQCKHCSHFFSTWHAFYYHVNTQSCEQLRAPASGQSPTAQEITLSDAVVENSELLNFAKACTWREIAEHPRVRSRHHHCPDCNQWHVRPQYVKRHMLHRHPQHAPLIMKAEKLMVASNLSLQNPCQYCGMKYQRKSAHLKACIGIFNGTYLYLRIARGKPLEILEDGADGGSEAWRMPPRSWNCSEVWRRRMCGMERQARRPR